MTTFLEGGRREEPVKVTEKQVKEAGRPDQCRMRKARLEWLHHFGDPVQKGKARSFVKKNQQEFDDGKTKNWAPSEPAQLTLQVAQP